MCTRDYRPVCGKNNITYSNACEMRCSNIELNYNGKCCECSSSVTYVCGTNGVTYDNACKLNCAGAK